jgi:RNA polymerase sigma-70 factor, ECF subfamily
VYYLSADGIGAAGRNTSEGKAPSAFPDDLTLANALKDGRSDAASAAWRRFRPVVQGTLRRMLGSSDDIPDLTQDVFARFFHRIQSLRSPESLRFFVIGIAFRRAREEIRRRHVQRSLRAKVETHFRQREGALGPEQGAIAATLARLLEELGQDGEIYLLRILHGCDLPEISRLTHLSISTVRRRFNRARSWMETRTQDLESRPAERDTDPEEPGSEDRVGGGGVPLPEPERGGVWGPSEGPHQDDTQSSGTGTQARFDQLSMPSSAS